MCITKAAEHCGCSVDFLFGTPSHSILSSQVDHESHHFTGQGSFRGNASLPLPTETRSTWLGQLVLTRQQAVPRPWEHVYSHCKQKADWPLAMLGGKFISAHLPHWDICFTATLSFSRKGLSDGSVRLHIIILVNRKTSPRNIFHRATLLIVPLLFQ